MAATTGSSKTRWVVLVGIDFYPGDTCLQGAVRDVNDIKGTLSDLKMLGSSTTSRTYVFTASTPLPGPNTHTPAQNLPLETNRSVWPVYENLVGALKTIRDQSQAGDLVYMHYSGHGTRLPNGQMALVLFDDHDVGRPQVHFPGRLLGGLMQRLSAKGVFATLVLDCCFSGGIFRGGGDRPAGGDEDGIRFIPYRKSLDAHPGLGEVEDQDHELWLPNDWRDASLHPDDWLINPDGYAVLSATNPFGTAREMTVNETAERRGAFSYFLAQALRSLKKENTELPVAQIPSNIVIYKHISALFQACCPQQTPMQYGNPALTFFGPPAIELQAIDAGKWIYILRPDNDTLYLTAGQVHDVQAGDEFAAYPPFHTPKNDHHDRGDGEEETLNMIHLRVIKVQPLMSEALVVMPVDSKTSRPVDGPGIDTGWKARLLRATPRIVPVAIGVLERGGDLPSLSEGNLNVNPGRYPYLRLLFGNASRGASPTSSETPAFNVIITESNEYQILDSSHEPIVSLPKVPRDAKNARPDGSSAAIETGSNDVPRPTLGLKGPEHVLGILNHLSKFKIFEGITNKAPDPALERTFSVSTLTDVGTNSTVENTFEITQGTEWGFSIQNKGSENLYLSVLNFSPSWEVSDLFSDAGKTGFMVIPPENVDWDESRQEVRLVTEVPERLRSVTRRCRDVIKVFVTNRVVDLSALMLPKIPLCAGEVPAFLRAGDRNATYGDGNDNKHLRELLLGLGLGLGSSGYDDCPISRGGGEECSQARWATRDFVIYTTAPLN